MRALLLCKFKWRLPLCRRRMAPPPLTRKRFLMALFVLTPFAPALRLPWRTGQAGEGMRAGAGAAKQVGSAAEEGARRRDEAAAGKVEGRARRSIAANMVGLWGREQLFCFFSR